VSVDAMEKFGILEKGMELDDVAGYAEGTTFGAPEQLFLLRVAKTELGVTLNEAFFSHHSAYHSNFFKLVKGAPKCARRTSQAVTGITRLVDGVKRRVRRRLNRL
jgi:hypothetical protein